MVEMASGSGTTGPPAKEKVDHPSSSNAALEKLWKNALEQYRATNNITEETLLVAGSFSGAENGIDKTFKMFELHRHPQNKQDKVVVAIGNCLDWIDASAGFLAEHISGTAATPAKIIAGAVSYLIKAAKQVTDDLDLIADTFTTISNAIEDIGPLEPRKLEQHFPTKLIEIFIAVLEFCSMSTKVFQDRGKKWLYFRDVFKGPNEKIKKRCTMVTVAIQRFREQVPLRTYDTVVQTESKVDKVDGEIIAVGGKIDIMDKVVEFKLDTVQASVDHTTSLFKELESKLNPATVQYLGPRNRYFEKIEKQFSVSIRMRMQADRQVEIIAKNFVEDTFVWLEKESAYATWIQGKVTPFLCIQGPRGSGRTYLTYHCYKLIQKQMKAPDHQSTMLAYIFLRPEHTLDAILSTILVQVAECDAKLCEQIWKQLENEKSMTKGTETGNADRSENTIPYKKLWESYIKGNFQKSSRTLFILLDGIDQLLDQSAQLLELFKGLDCNSHSIQIMMTGDMENFDLMTRTLRLKAIDLVSSMHKEGDIRKIVQSRISQSTFMNKFSQDHKVEIWSHLSSGKILVSLVDPCLSVMEQSSVEEKALEKMRNTPQDEEGYYSSMAELVSGDRSVDIRPGFEAFYAWSIFSRKWMTISEMDEILKLDPSLQTFKFKSEIEARSKGIFQIQKGEDTGYGLSYPPQNTDPNDPSSSVSDEKDSDCIVFSRPQFKDYLRKHPRLILQRPLQAQVDIFTRICDILCNQDSVGLVSRKVLRDYATRFFVHHLADIDIKGTTPEQGREVVEGLSKVMTNENKVNIVFEETIYKYGVWTAQNFDLYQQLISPGNDSLVEVDKILCGWAKKMNLHDEEKLSPRAERWVKTTINRPERLLKALAFGHIRSWSTKVTYDDAKLAFTLASACLSKMGVLSPLLKEPVSTILNIATRLSDNRPNEIARARVSAALVANEFAYKVSLYTENLESNISGSVQFYSCVGLAELYSKVEPDTTEDENRERLKKVAEYASRALLQRESEIKAWGTELDPESCTSAFWWRVSSLEELGDHGQEIIDTCRKAINELEMSDKTVDFINIMVEQLAKEKRWHEIILEVTNIPRQTRSEWIYFRSDSLTDKDDIFREAAVRTRRTDFAIEMYKEAIRYFALEKKKLSYAQILQIELAMIYRSDTQVISIAKQTLSDLLSQGGADLSDNNTGNVIRYALPELVDILHEEFMQSHNQEVKTNIIATMRKNIEEPGTNALLENMSKAMALLTLAKLLKINGKVMEAEVEATKAFDLCMHDLQDKVGFNDSEAFRVLAKVLIFADLKLEAEISTSLQFSAVQKSFTQDNESDRSDMDSISDDGTVDFVVEPTKNVAPKADGSEVSSIDQIYLSVEEHRSNQEGKKPENNNSVNGHHDAEGEALANGIEERAVVSDDSKTNVNGITQSKPAEVEDAAQDKPNGIRETGIEEEDHATTKDTSDGNQTAVNEAVKGSMSSNGLEQAGNNSMSSNGLDQAGKSSLSSNGLQQAGKSSIPSNSLDIAGVGLMPSNSLGQSDNQKPEVKQSPPNADIDHVEDLLPGIYCEYICSGACSTPAYTHWEPEVFTYMCLDCPDVVFCQNCYDQQTKFVNLEGDGFWFKVCWGKHQYLKQPLEDWKGIKDGVFRRGTMETPFKQWLEDLKAKWAKKMTMVERQRTASSIGFSIRNVHV